MKIKPVRPFLIIALMQLLNIPFAQAQIKYYNRIQTNSKIVFLNNINNINNSIYGFGIPIYLFNSSGPKQQFVKFNANSGFQVNSNNIDTIAGRVNGMANIGSSTFFLNHDIFFCGEYTNFGQHSNSVFGRIDTNGSTSILKLTQFNFPSSFYVIVQSKEENVFAAGALYTDTTSNFLITTGNICKLDTAGNILWQYKRFGNFANQPDGMIATADSGVLVSLAVGPWHNFNSGILLKLDKDGHKQWEKNLPLPQGLYDVQIKGYYPEKQEYVIFINRTDSDKNLLIRVDSAMHPVWQLDMTEWNSHFQRWEGTVYDIKRIKGGYIGIGGTQQGIGGRTGAVIVKIDDNGKKLWQAVYDTSASTFIKPYDKDMGFTSIDTMPDGGYIVSGGTYDSLHNQVGFLMRIDSLGCLTDGNCETRYFTGINPLTKEDGVVRLYPNPANTKIYIDYTATAKESKLQIIDAVGKEVFSTYNYSKDMPIDVSTFPAGIYFISLENAEGRFRGKFVRE